MSVNPTLNGSLTLGTTGWEHVNGSMQLSMLLLAEICSCGLLHGRVGVLVHAY